MNINITNPRIVLDHARQHLSLLTQMIEAWKRGDNVRFDLERNSEATHFLIKLNIKTDPNLVGMGLVFSDCLNNIRSALEHAIFGAVSEYARTINGRQALPNKVQFLIIDDEPGFDRVLSKYKMTRLPDDLKSTLRAFQPFNRPHELTPPLLAVLRDLNNSSKHNVLTPALFTSNSFLVQLRGVRPGNEVTRLQRPFDELSSGQILTAFSSRQPNPELEVQPQITFTFTIPHDPGPKGLKRSNCAALAAALIDEVDTALTALGY